MRGVALEAIDLELPAFRGPLSLLTELIEKRRLEITEVSLASVAEQYLGKVLAMEMPSMDILADFLVVASKLLLLKCRQLLPPPSVAPEPEDESESLEAQLREYQVVQRAAMALAGLESAGLRCHPHPPRIAVAPILPALAPIEPRILALTLSQLLHHQSESESSTPAPERYRPRVREKIVLILEALAEGKQRSFRELATGNVADLVACFLALLQLLKTTQVEAAQASPFADISLRAAISSQVADG